MTQADKKLRALAYYYAHRDRILERQRERYRNDEDYREYRLNQAKTWHRDNPTQSYHNHKSWVEANKDKVAGYYKKWYAKNRDKKREYVRQYYVEHREEILQKAKEAKKCLCSCCSAE